MKNATTAADAIVAPPLVTPAAAPKLAKTTTITLHASDGSYMYIVAERLAAGAKTYILTTDSAKKTARGMTEQHATFELAQAAIAIRALEAQKAGWIRRAPRVGFVKKADAFAAMPTAPKLAKSAKK